MTITNIYTSEQGIVALDVQGIAYILVKDMRENPDDVVFKWIEIKENNE